MAHLSNLPRVGRPAAGMRRHATPRHGVPECGKPLGTRLAPNGAGGWAWVPYSCGKPATATGPDGVLRCVQHDRMARGLPGKWTGKA